MLGKANAKYKASAPPPQPVKADLAKQLFPSSSPSIRDGNIGDSFKKNHGSFQSSASSGSLRAAGHDPLKPKSNNLAQRRPNASSVTSFVKPTQGFSSLVNKSDSFKDELVASTGPSQAKSVASVYIADEDFSDDENLELDYECPSSLPPLPVTQNLGRATPKSDLPPVPCYGHSTPAQPTSEISWGTSPLEHHYPPATRKPSAKRESPEDIVSTAPGFKRRKLPVTYPQVAKREPIDVDRPDSSVNKPSATPATKQKTLHWDTTYSATKKNREQFKKQNKKAGSGVDLTMDEMRAATGGATVPKTSAVSLSLEQQHVIELVTQKKQSVFFTGPAGTGKSVLMRAIIADLKKKWARDPERLSVTASTGLAACNIGGSTLHSFAGIGLGKEDVPTLVKKIRRNAKAKNRWLRTNTLIIDEISMVDGDLFDKLAQVARTIRNNGRPWGGIQLVITGDFFQLPPVPDRDKRDTKFAFEAATWNTSIDHTIGLTQVFRQRDPHFANMLNEMRLGRITEDTVKTFKDLSRPLTFDDGLDVTELFPTRQEVERSNEMRLRNLQGSTFRFEAADTGEPNVRDRLLENMMAPKSIDLKKGAQVMLIKNMDDTLVNGSLGKVRGFMSEAAFEIWGAHEEPGSSDEADGDAGSRKKIKAYSRDPDSVKDLKEYPVVQFTGIDGNHRTLLMLPEDWKVELPNGEIQAQRRQLPLILAWALSIHKAQGQTLERVKVDLGKVFEKGQAYVALSRATTKQGLQVLRFDKTKVMAHPRVIQFYNKLYSADTAIKKKETSTISDFAYKGQSKSSVRKGIEVFDLDDEEEALAAAYG